MYSFVSGFLQFNILVLRFIQVAVWVMSSFILIAEQYSIIWMYHNIHFLVEGYRVVSSC